MRERSSDEAAGAQACTRSERAREREADTATLALALCWAPCRENDVTAPTQGDSPMLIVIDLSSGWLPLLFLLALGPLLTWLYSIAVTRRVAPAVPRAQPRAARHAPGQPRGGAAVPAPLAWLMGLLGAPVDDEPAPREEQPRRSRARGEAAVGAVHRLPLEEFKTEAELRTLGVVALKKLLGDARRAASAGSRRAEPVPLEKGELIAAVMRQRGMDGSSGSTCGVCLGDYASGAILRILPCGHRFHVECIDGWLVSHSAACPFCSLHVG